MIDDQFIIHADPRVVLREEFDHWGILFNPDTNAVISINATGMAIWRLIDGQRRLSDIANDLHKEYDQIPNEIQQQVNAFIDELMTRGFVLKTEKSEK